MALGSRKYGKPARLPFAERGETGQPQRQAALRTNSLFPAVQAKMVLRVQQLAQE